MVTYRGLPVVFSDADNTLPSMECNIVIPGRAFLPADAPAEHREWHVTRRGRLVRRRVTESGSAAFEAARLEYLQLRRAKAFAEAEALRRHEARLLARRERYAQRQARRRLNRARGLEAALQAPWFWRR